MLNEHERDDGPEEGEYHFSDEGGYETGMEEEAKAPTLTEGGGLAAKFSAYRRFVVIGAIFAAVFLVAYLIIPPLTTSTSTEIVASNAPAPIESPAVTNAPAPNPIVSAKPETPAPLAESRQPSGFSKMISAEKEKLTAEKNKVMSHITAQPPQPTSSLSMPSDQLTQNTAPSEPPAAVMEQQAAAAATPAIGSPEFISSPIGSVLGPTPQSMKEAADNKALLDRLAALQEANTKLIGQMQAEYAQKLADYEVRDKTMQEQVKSLSARLASMQEEMNKLVQVLNNSRQSPSAPPPSVRSEATNMSMNTPPPTEGYNNSVNLPPTSSVSVTGIQAPFKGGYTVQAIIPGRAWLRSESGETITVAEGDVLKSLGRVTKIDPYDGTIQIDTGSRMVTLTYGTGDYA